MAATVTITRPETIAEASAAALIRYISDNGLSAGDRLPSERELVAMTGISRLSLREGLCMLRGLGIVESHQGKGVFVKPLDMASVFRMLSPLLKTQTNIDVNDLFTVRLSLETCIAESAATKRTPEELDRLEEALSGMAENFMYDRRAYIECDMAFHQELARSTRNPIFHLMLVSLTDLLVELQSKYRDKTEFRESALSEHRAILDAVKSGNGEQASAAMLEHLSHAMQRIE